jgi:predicted lipoprotein with Yx(FWY)xxD motif
MNNNPGDESVRTTVVRTNLIRRGGMVGVALVAALSLAACGDNGSKTTAGSNSTSTSNETSTTAATSNTATGPVRTATNATLGKVLVDEQGKTLYVFDPDQGGTIACGAGCTTAWPPLLLQNGASLPTSGALSGDLTTVTRPEGGQQVAYKGRPLYRFANDAQPGDAKGDGLGNVWHAVKV